MAAGSTSVGSTARRLMGPSDPGRLLKPFIFLDLNKPRRSGKSARDATAALRETVEGIWKVVEQASSERALDGSLLARRELVQRGTCALSTVIRQGVASGAFRPGCESWAIRRLPFAIVAGACAHWVLGLATGPSLRSSTAVAATLEILRPRQRGSRVPRKHEPAVNILEG
jgi:hypothetical protein